MLNKTPGAVVLIIVTLLAVQPALPQSNRVDARMVDKEKGSIRKIKVQISYDDSALNIEMKGRRASVNTFLFSDIKSANYTYSERIQIAEGIGATAFTLSTGYLVPALAIGTTFLTSKKKTHWLGLQVEDRSLILELKKDDYRQLLLDLKTRGVNVLDLGKSERVRK